jgi:hypothetical protein
MIGVKVGEVWSLEFGVMGTQPTFLNRNKIEAKKFKEKP